MTEFDAEREEEEDTAALRSAAVEALQSAARQHDPKEFDRLTRYALGLIERARAITHRRRGGISEADGADTPDEHRAEEKQGPAAFAQAEGQNHRQALAARFVADWAPMTSYR